MNKTQKVMICDDCLTPKLAEMHKSLKARRKEVMGSYGERFTESEMAIANCTDCGARLPVNEMYVIEGQCV